MSPSFGGEEGRWFVMDRTCWQVSASIKIVSSSSSFLCPVGPPVQLFNASEAERRREAQQIQDLRRRLTREGQKA